MLSAPKAARTARAAGLLVVLGAAIAALTWASAAPLGALTTGRTVGYDAALGGCAAAVAWLVVVWFVGCVALTLLGRLPGAVGRCAAGLAERVTPAVFRRLVQASLGATLVLATSTQLAPAATASAPLHVATATGLLARPTPPSPDRPDVKPTKPSHGRQVVRVRPGDSLWRIAATHMSGQPTDRAIAREWHRWYAANRTVIGGDPNLIVPGQRLHPPAS